MKIGNYEIQVPFVTTSSDAIATILELADLQPDDTMIDIGAGEGRVVIAFARQGFIAKGFEIKPELVHRAQQKIRDLGLEEIATVTQTDFWEQDLSSYAMIYIYGMSTIMGRLEEKLEKELQPGTKVISNIFRFPHWKVKKEKNHVLLYIKQ